MKQVEIITLRSLVKENRRLVDELLHQLFQQKESGFTASIRVYHHPDVETDLSIHIHGETEARHPGKSPLGLRFSSALGPLGLLNYSVWVESASLEFPDESRFKGYPVIGQEGGFAKLRNPGKEGGEDEGVQILSPMFPESTARRR
jgi:hypothetical protein